MINNKPVSPLESAITDCNIDLVMELFTIDNVTYNAISNIVRTPILYPTLELLLENNNKLCVYIREKIATNRNIAYNISIHINVQLLNIVLKYLSSEILLKDIFLQVVRTGNFEMLDILFIANYDIKSEFDAIMLFHTPSSRKINFDTFINLAQYSVDILFHLNNITESFFYYNDIAGVEKCLKYGADVNYIITHAERYHKMDVNMIDLLVNYGADFSKLRSDAIQSIIRADGDDSLPIIKYLAQNGVNIFTYYDDLEDFIIWADYAHILEYFIKSEVNIDLNETLYSACRQGAVNCVKLVLEYGADVSTDTKIINTIGQGIINCNRYDIIKLLITYGAIISDPLYTFCLYLVNCKNKFDIRLFAYLLDCGINFNNKFNIHVTPFNRNILDAVIYFGPIELLELCLTYGADFHIDNDSPLKTAIRFHKFNAVKILLDIGSNLDPDFECDVSLEIIDLLDQYNITHKLKKID